MARSLQQRLDDCDAAIAKIETGAQSYTARGRGAQQAMYDKLCDERRKLEDMISDAGIGGGSMASVCQIDRPS